MRRRSRARCRCSRAADLSPSWASSKLTALISAPAPKARTRPTCRGGQRRAKLSSAPMTSELAASAPQPIAAAISATLLAMTLVVKLGSSIVAADDGELRTDVLDSVCEQVSALERGGERVVMVTSGAIARGMRLMELPVRPRAMDELQARLRGRPGRPLPRLREPPGAGRDPGGAGAADRGRHRRPHQLPERPPDPAAAGRVGRGAGDQRERHHRHRRDHLRRQRLPRRPGGAAARRPAAGAADQRRRALHAPTRRSTRTPS